MSLEAATEGLGVALESATIAGRHMAERKLRPVFGLEKAIKIKAHFAVYPPRHAKRSPVEAFGMAARGSGQELDVSLTRSPSRVLAGDLQRSTNACSSFDSIRIGVDTGPDVQRR